MSNKFCHLFYSESYRNHPESLARQATSMALVPVDKKISCIIPAKPQYQSLANEATKQIIENNKQWRSDPVHKWVLEMVGEPKVVVLTTPVYILGNLDLWGHPGDAQAQTKVES
jgi:hypothetical protein